MSHSFQVPDDLYTELATYAARRGQSPDVLLMDLVKEGVEQLKQTDSMAALRKIPYDPAHDPLAPFIGAFDSGNDEPGWIERHDEFFAGYQQVVAQRRLLVTTNYIIAELVALLTSRSRIPRQQIVLFIDALKTATHIEVIHIDLDLDAASWTLLKAHADKEWSLVDASSFVVMSKHGMTEALTTDHHFTQAGFVRIPARNSIK